MTGYFTLYKFLRGQPMRELEIRLGFRPGRLTSKGALVYRFLRLPMLQEFDLRGFTIWTEQSWQSEVAPERSSILARSALYHQNHPNVPDSDKVQKRNALASMALSGPNLLVKLVPVEFIESVDGSADGYQHGSGIPQWRLNEKATIEGELLFNLAARDSVPWRL